MIDVHLHQIPIAAKHDIMVFFYVGFLCCKVLKTTYSKFRCDHRLMHGIAIQPCALHP